MLTYIKRNISLFITILVIILIQVFDTNGYLYKTGYIHLVTVGLFIPAVIVFWNKYHFINSAFRKLTQYSLLALMLLLSTHIFEYFWTVKNLPNSVADVIVMITYFLAMAFLYIGFQTVLFSTKFKNNQPTIIIPLIILLLSIGLFLFYKGDSLSLTTLSTAVVVFGIFILSWGHHTKRHIPIMKPFVCNLMLASTFIAIAALAELIEGLVPYWFGEMYSTYIAHYFIFIAIAFFYRGLQTFMLKDGVYKDI